MHLYERSDHVLVALAVGEGAFSWDGGSNRYSCDELRVKADTETIRRALARFPTDQIALQVLLAVTPGSQSMCSVLIFYLCMRRQIDMSWDCPFSSLIGAQYHLICNTLAM